MTRLTANRPPDVGSTPAAWGQAQVLTPLETLMWRADIDPMTRSTALAVEILDSEPDWERLWAAHDWASRMVPRLCDRVIEPLGPLGSAMWVGDRDIDLHYHVRRMRLGGNGDWDELLSIAEQFAMTPLDRGRPPWEAMLVTGLPSGKAAYLLKLHHALSDGMGLTQLLSQLHSRQRGPSPDKARPTAPPRNEPTLTDLLTRQLRTDLAAVPSVVHGAMGVLSRLARKPLATPREAVRYANSARRVLSPPAVAGLPLLAARGPSWRFVAIEMSLVDLRAAGKAAGGTLNDAFLAALMGAFRLYHQQCEQPLPHATVMPVSVPVSVRTDADSGGGNRFAPARLAGPVGEPDPAVRIRVIHDLVAAARAETALEAADYVAPTLARLPASAVSRIAAMASAANDLQASNVPGVAEDMYLAGARIERIFPFAPLPGCAAMITLHTYRGICTVGANLDAAAFPEPQQFRQCLLDGFTEVLNLVPSADAPKPLG